MFVQGEDGGGLVVGVGAQFVEEEGEGVFVVCYQRGEGGGGGVEGGDCGFGGGEARLEVGEFGGAGCCCVVVRSGYGIQYLKVLMRVCGNGKCYHLAPRSPLQTSPSPRSHPPLLLFVE